MNKIAVPKRREEREPQAGEGADVERKVRAREIQHERDMEGIGISHEDFFKTSDGDYDIDEPEQRRTVATPSADRSSSQHMSLASTSVHVFPSSFGSAFLRMSDTMPMFAMRSLIK